MQVGACIKRRLGLHTQAPPQPFMTAGVLPSPATGSLHGRRQACYDTLLCPRCMPHPAGFMSAALCSVLVGSVHYASFCCSKRLALQGLDAASSSSSSHSGSDSSHSANMLAASIGALATALVESPVEMFRHQAQAGTVGGNFVQEMATSVRKNVSGRPLLLMGARTVPTA